MLPRLLFVSDCFCFSPTQPTIARTVHGFLLFPPNLMILPEPFAIFILQFYPLFSIFYELFLSYILLQCYYIFHNVVKISLFRNNYVTAVTYLLQNLIYIFYLL